MGLTFGLLRVAIPLEKMQDAHYCSLCVQDLRVKPGCRHARVIPRLRDGWTTLTVSILRQSRRLYGVSRSKRLERGR
jgi:hypothetical protein